MSDTASKRRTELEEALSRTQGQGVSKQADALESLMTEPTQEATDRIWVYLVVGILILIGLGIVGLVLLLMEDKSADTMLTVITALVTGLLGLFIKSPGGDTPNS